jgi:phosphohistidine phosphatase
LCSFLICENQYIAAMKTLLLIRHAKSSWASMGEADFDRPLSERGKREVAEMSEKILNQSIKITAFVSSPAKRAYTTCKAFAAAYGKSEEDIHLIEELYHAAPETFYKVIATLNDEDDNVAIFSHNPGITEFVSMVCGKLNYIDMPTCGIFALTVDINSWKEFDNTERKFLFFKYPKEN